MLPSFIYRLLKRRHFWRYATFDEVAELYASRTMRLLAQYMVSLFIALYLYQQGYSILFIALFFTAYFTIKIPITYIAAMLAARFGPKHGIVAANLLYIPALLSLSLVPQLGFYAIIAFGLLQAWSVSIYSLCFMVDFSKVKHLEHAGKEIGFMQILERLATSLAPLFGGIIASFFSVEAAMWASAILLALASWPLLRTAEPTMTGQRLQFRGFPWRTTWRSLVATTAEGMDTFASSMVWVLFITVVVFAGSGNDIYFKVGAFASLTVVTSFVTAYAFGRLIDRQRGGDLLRISTMANALTHLVRPFITTPIGVATTNITNEITTVGYTMAFNRGIFDTADNTGRRIVYVLLIETFFNLGAVLACLILAGLLVLLSSQVLAMQVFFVIAAFYTLLLMTARFSLYRK